MKTAPASINEGHFMTKQHEAVRRRQGTFSLLVCTACLVLVIQAACCPARARAHAQLNLQCNPSSGNLIPFYIWYSSNQGGMDTVDVTIDLWDINGNYLGSSDVGTYNVTYDSNRAPLGTLTSTNGTGDASDAAASGGTAQLTASGNYSGDSCGPYLCQSPAPTQYNLRYWRGRHGRCYCYYECSPTPAPTCCKASTPAH